MAKRLQQVNIEYPPQHAGQLTVREQAKRFNWLAAGRRWRKTTFFMTLAMDALMQKQDVLWLAPIEAQVQIGFMEARRASDGGVKFKSSPRPEAWIPGRKKRVIFRSLEDPDLVRGYTADLIVIDEASFVKPYAYYEVVRPIVSDSGGTIWCGGTPRGRNWFWQEFERAKSGEIANSACWQVPTLGVKVIDGQLTRAPHPLENSDFSFEELWGLWKSMPERSFRQEYLAEFIEGGGGVFRRVREAAVLEPGVPQEGHEYGIGVDWARSEDFTVFSVIDITTKEQVEVQRFTDIDYVIQGNRLVALYEKWRPTIILAEATGIGGPNIEYLLRRDIPIIPFNTGSASKLLIIDDLTSAFERGAIKILNEQACKVQIDELEAYESQRLESGIVRFHCPSGFHDDTVIALALCWQLAKHDSLGDVYAQRRSERDVMTVAEWFASMGFHRKQDAVSGKFHGGW